MLLHPCVVIVSPVNLKKISDGQLVLWPWPLPLRPQLLEAKLSCYTSNVTKPPPRFLLWEERDTPVSLWHYWLDFQQRKTERRESKALFILLHLDTRYLPTSTFRYYRASHNFDLDPKRTTKTSTATSDQIHVSTPTHPWCRWAAHTFSLNNP